MKRQIVLSLAGSSLLLVFSGCHSGDQNALLPKRGDKKVDLPQTNGTLQKDNVSKRLHDKVVWKGKKDDDLDYSICFTGESPCTQGKIIPDNKNGKAVCNLEDSAFPASGTKAYGYNVEKGQACQADAHPAGPQTDSVTPCRGCGELELDPN